VKLPFWFRLKRTLRRNLKDGNEFYCMRTSKELSSDIMDSDLFLWGFYFFRKAHFLKSVKVVCVKDMDEAWEKRRGGRITVPITLHEFI
jgi:hypothetical protein